jgi:hypothetical protein
VPSEDEVQSIKRILGSVGEPGAVLFVLFIPSKTGAGKDLPATESQRLWADAAGRMLTEEFTGATEMPIAKGLWQNPKTKEIVSEDVILIHSYAEPSRAKDPARLERLAEFLHRMGHRTKQGEVAVVIEGIMYKIDKFPKADRGSSK